MLKINHLSFTYRKSGLKVFNDFSLQFREGEVYGLFGFNGAGKSTLIYLMSGLLIPDDGEVLYNSIDVSYREPSTMSDIFVVPEEFELPSMLLPDYVAINAPFYPRFSHDNMPPYDDVYWFPTFFL